MENTHARRLLLPAAILAFGLVIAAVAFGAFFYASRHDRSTVQVVGAATQGFDSDIVKWRVTLSRSVPSESQLAQGYRELEGDVRGLMDRMQQRGLADSAISLQPPSSQPMYGQNGTIRSYQIMQSLTVVSSDIQTVESWALDPASLLASGLVLQGSNLEYYYSGLDTLKRQLLAAATKDARARADEIASSSDTRVGDLVAARAGVFQITEPYSTEVAGYGVYNTQSKKKEITVTVHATFTLD